MLYNTGHLQSQNSVENAWKAEKRLTFVPVVFVLLRMWGTIRFFWYYYRGLRRSSWFTRALLYLHVRINCTSQYFNHIVFAFFFDFTVVIYNFAFNLNVAQNSFQHFPRRRFWLVIITTLCCLMPGEFRGIKTLPNHWWTCCCQFCGTIAYHSNNMNCYKYPKL